MRITNEGTAVTAVLGTVLTPGTATGDAVDWTPNYANEAKAIASMGAVSAGTCTVWVNGGTAAGDVATSYGTVRAIGSAQGTTTLELDIPSVTTRYVSGTVTMEAGTVTPVAVTFLAHQRTT